MNDQGLDTAAPTLITLWLRQLECFAFSNYAYHKLLTWNCQTTCCCFIPGKDAIPPKPSKIPLKGDRHHREFWDSLIMTLLVARIVICHYTYADIIAQECGLAHTCCVPSAPHGAFIAQAQKLTRLAVQEVF